MQEVIEKILSEAVYAPSGDNSQPWTFSCRENTIDIFNLPDRDNPIFNFKQHGSYIAHGALIQNIILLAKDLGYEAKIELFPKKENPNNIASVTLTPSRIENPNIDGVIKKRVTNRKKYKPYQLTSEQKQVLISKAGENTSGAFLMTEDKKSKQKLAQAASTSERIMLEYQPLHQAFFSMLRWNRGEETNKKYGMLIDTLELNFPQKLIFKWFSHWDGAALLRKIGLPAFIAKENSKIYSSASAIGIIIMAKTESADYIYTGMMLQNIWLTVTNLGLSMQPIAGALYLEERLKAGAMEDLPSDLKMLLTDSVHNIYAAFENPFGKITMMFRIGLSKAPSANSAKFPPIILKQN